MLHRGWLRALCLGSWLVLPSCGVAVDPGAGSRATENDGGHDRDASPDGDGSAADPGDASAAADAAPTDGSLPDAAPPPDAAVPASCGAVDEMCCEEGPICGFGDPFIECDEKTQTCQQCGADGDPCCETGDQCQDPLLLGCVGGICSVLL